MPDALNPVIRVPNIKGGEVDVRELKWRDYLRAIKELTDNVLTFAAAVKSSGDPKKKPEPEGTKVVDLANVGALILDKDKLIDAVTRSESLAGWVLAASTGKDEAWVNDLSGRETMAILKAVVELNLSKEILGTGKELVGHMRGVFGST